MGPHNRIKERLKSLLGMSKPAINVRFSPVVVNEMDELVESGQFLTKADIINQAVIEFLQRNGLRSVIREEIKKILDEKEK